MTGGLKKIQIELCLFWVQAIPCWTIRDLKVTWPRAHCFYQTKKHKCPVPMWSVRDVPCPEQLTEQITVHGKEHVAKEQLQILKSTILVDYILIEFRQIENICKMSLGSSKNVKYNFTRCY